MQSVYSTNLLLCNKESGLEGEGGGGVGGGGRDHFSGLQFATLPSTSAVAAYSEETKALKACIKQLGTEVQTHNFKTEHQEAVGRAPSSPKVRVHVLYGWLLWLWYV